MRDLTFEVILNAKMIYYEQKILLFLRLKIEIVSKLNDIVQYLLLKADFMNKNKVNQKLDNYFAKKLISPFDNFYK